MRKLTFLLCCASMAGIIALTGCSNGNFNTSSGGTQDTLATTSLAKGASLSKTLTLNLGSGKTTLVEGEDVTSLIDQTVVAASSGRAVRAAARAASDSASDLKATVTSISSGNTLIITITATMPDSDCSIVLAIRVPIDDGSGNVASKTYALQCINVGSGAALVNESSTNNVDSLPIPAGSDLAGKKFRVAGLAVSDYDDEGGIEFYIPYITFPTATTCELYLYEAVKGVLHSYAGDVSFSYSETSGYIQGTYDGKSDPFIELREVNGSYYGLAIDYDSHNTPPTTSRYAFTRISGSGLYDSIFQYISIDSDGRKEIEQFQGTRDGTLLWSDGEGWGEAGTWINSNGIITGYFTYQDDDGDSVENAPGTLLYDGENCYLCFKFEEVKSMPGEANAR